MVPHATFPGHAKSRRNTRWRASIPSPSTWSKPIPAISPASSWERRMSKSLELLDNEQPTPQTFRTDSLIRVRLGGEEVLIHTEFQTTDSTRVPMPRRMAGYIGSIIERHDLPVCSSVLYLRPEAGRRDPGHFLQERRGHRILVEYRVIRLIEQEGQGILEAGTPGLLPFAPLMKPPARLPPEAWLTKCMQAALRTAGGPVRPGRPALRPVDSQRSGLRGRYRF